MNLFPSPVITNNPLLTRHSINFSIMALVWITIGLYLLLNFPLKSGKIPTLFAHLAATVIQIILPYFLFPNFAVVIPLPIPPIVSLLVLGFYLRNREQDTSTQETFDDKEV